MEELLKELEEAKQKIADIEKKIGEKKSETGRWKPEEEDEYWFVDSSGQAMYNESYTEINIRGYKSRDRQLLQ